MTNKYCDEIPTPSIAVLLIIAFFVYSIFSVSIGSPIFGSDEYAYFISGKYFDNLAELYKLDSGLQQISNVLYFQLIYVWAKFTDSGFTHTFRILHAAEYILTAFIIYQTFSKIINRNSAYFGTLAFLLLPNVIYIYAVMPETELVLLTACLGYVLIVVFPRRQYVAGGLAGFLLGVSILIKPHAVATLAAAVVIVSAAPIFGLVKGGRSSAIRTTLIMLGACFLSLILLWRLCGHEWSLNPTAALGLNSYGQFLHASLPAASFASKAMNALHYAAAHLAVIALIFAPVLVWSVSILLKTMRRRVGKQEYMASGIALSALFVCSMLALHIAMAAWFTAGAAALIEGEAMRLHGRYLGPVIAFLPFLYFHAIQNLDARGEKAVKLVMLAALLSCLFFFGEFKIFPWDYPLLFAFFKAPNHYRWDFDGSFASLGFLMLWAMIIVWFLAIFFSQIQKRILYVQIFIIFLAGCVQTYDWAFSHTKVSGPLTDYSHLISAILGQNQFGKGLLVSDERYGRASYILFGLANAPKVLVKKPKSKVNTDDVAGASWVLFGNEYTADFDYLDSIALGPFRFFPFNSGLTVDQRAKKNIKPGQQVRLLLSSGQYAAARLKGFNSQENWGVWTAEPRAEIELPIMVHGVIKLKMFGFTLPQNMEKPVSVKIGDVSSQVVLSDAGKEYEITMNVSQPSDRIFLESPVFHPANSSHAMGVGISIITIEQQSR